MISYLWLTLLLFALMLSEGTVLQFISPDAWGGNLQMIPHFVLVGIIYIALYLGRRTGLWFGLALGLLQDILYSDVIGVYAFGMALVGYFSGLAFKLFHQSLLLVLLTILLSVLIYDLVVYGFFTMFGLVQTGFHWTVMNQLIPTLFLNALFAVLVYIPMGRFLSGISIEQNEHNF